MNVRQCIAFVSGIAVPNKIEGLFGRFEGGSALLRTSRRDTFHIIEQF